MIQFEECKKSGYSARTEQNIVESDATIAFAVDATTAGERCTKRLAGKHEKPFLFVPLNGMISFVAIQEFLEKHQPKVLNIAGNGIYTLKVEQERVHKLMFSILFIMKNRKALDCVQLIQSGGQTGIDEAGITAAEALGINAKIVAPKDWMFRDLSGKDIKSENLFKARFTKNGE